MLPVYLFAFFLPNYIGFAEDVEESRVKISKVRMLSTYQGDSKNYEEVERNLLPERLNQLNITVPGPSTYSVSSSSQNSSPSVIGHIEHAANVRIPSIFPSRFPTRIPTRVPSRKPTTRPSAKPTTPSRSPSTPPSIKPSQSPTFSPTYSQRPTIRYPSYSPVSRLVEAGIQYNGGSIMLGKVNTYIIWYGDWSGVKGAGSNAAAQGIITDFISNLGGSSYWNIMTTYTGLGGSRLSNSLEYKSSITVQGSDPIDQSTAWSIIQKAITSKSLPTDRNGVYLLIPSEDILDYDNVDDSRSGCVNYCGYHTFEFIGSTPIIWSLITNPFGCPNQKGCLIFKSGSINNNAAADAMVSVVAHELAEAVTDPLYNAWYKRATADENGDICAWNFGTTANWNIILDKKYLIQKMWVNAGPGECSMSFVGPVTFSPSTQPSLLPTSPSVVPTLQPTIPTISPTLMPSMPTLSPTAVSRALCFRQALPRFANRMSINGVKGNGRAFDAPLNVTLQYNWTVPVMSWCPGCSVQLYFGISGFPADNCVNAGSSGGVYRMSFQAELAKPGCYFIFSHQDYETSCYFFGAITSGTIVGAIWVAGIIPSTQPTVSPSAAPSILTLAPTTAPTLTASPTSTGLTAAPSPSAANAVKSSSPSQSRPQFLSPTSAPTALTRASCLATAPSSESAYSTINGVPGNTAELNEPGPINYVYNWQLPELNSCPQCLVQIYMGVVGYSTDMCVLTYAYITNLFTLTYTMNLPAPGCYNIFVTEIAGYYCGRYVADGDIVGAVWVGAPAPSFTPSSPPAALTRPPTSAPTSPSIRPTRRPSAPSRTPSRVPLHLPAAPGPTRAPTTTPSKTNQPVCLSAPSDKFKNLVTINSVLGNTATIPAPGAVTVVYNWNKLISGPCDGCIVQLYTGIVGYSTRNCLITYNDVTQLFRMTFTINLPSPGCYRIFAREDKNDYCYFNGNVTTGTVIGSIWVGPGSPSVRPTQTPQTALRSTRPTSPSKRPSVRPSTPSRAPTRIPSKVPVLPPTRRPTFVPTESTQELCFKPISAAYSSMVSINNLPGNLLTVASPIAIHVEYNWNVEPIRWCPGCVIQLYMGVSGFPSTNCILTYGSVSKTFTMSHTMTLPSRGCYRIFANKLFQYTCTNNVQSGQAIGAIWVGPAKPDTVPADWVVQGV